MDTLPKKFEFGQLKLLREGSRLRLLQMILAFLGVRCIAGWKEYERMAMTVLRDGLVVVVRES